MSLVLICTKGRVPGPPKYTQSRGWAQGSQQNSGPRDPSKGPFHKKKSRESWDVSGISFTSFNHGLQITKKPPRQTFKCYDTGKVPSHLTKHTLIDELAIDQSIVFQNVFNLRVLPTLHLTPLEHNRVKQKQVFSSTERR